jgi:hypothetical protein
LKENEYGPFDDLNKRCISGPCKTINASPVADVTVAAAIDRKGRKAVGVRFLVEPKDQTTLSEPEPHPAFRAARVPILPKTQQKYLALRSADEIALCIERANDYGTGQEKNGKPPNYGALYRTAVEEGWHAGQARKKAAASTAQAKKQAEANAKEEAGAADKAEKASSEAERTALLQRFAALPEDERGRILAAFLETDPLARGLYKERGFDSPFVLFPFVCFLKSLQASPPNAARAV